jgi:hypothetical protein
MFQRGEIMLQASIGRRKGGVSGSEQSISTAGLVVEILCSDPENDNNVIELRPPQAYFSSGFWDGVVTANPPALFPQIVQRRNVIRITDGVSNPPSGFSTIGFMTFAAGDVIIEENVMNVTEANPIQFNGCNSVKFLANQTPAGGLIQARNSATNTNVSELSSVEDAIIFAL